MKSFIIIEKKRLINTEQQARRFQQQAKDLELGMFSAVTNRNHPQTEETLKTHTAKLEREFLSDGTSKIEDW